MFLQENWKIWGLFGRTLGSPVHFLPHTQTVGYSVKPTSRDEDGLVILHFKKKEEEIRSLQQQLVDSLFKILGSKPTLSVCVEDVKPLPDDK